MTAGSTINHRYRLLRLAGEGGMGRVFLARDALHPERRTALKLLRPGVRGPGGARLRREFMALARLSHPSLIKVHDFGRVQGGRGEAFFTYDLVPGRDIARWFRRRKAPELYPLLLEICRALRFLHSRRLLHLDIKPSNIIVGSRGGRPSATLIDFGIHRGPGARRGAALGTLPYAAPELVAGGPVDARSDLYSLGATLYALVAGRPPAGDALAEGAGGLEGVPQGLRAVILRLLARDPDDRFQSAAELEAEVAELAGPLASRGTRDGVRRRRLTVGSAFVGRARDVATVVRAFEDARAGRDAAAILLIAGEAGAGKTRLLREVRARVQILGGTWLETACEETSQPGLPVRDLLHQAITVAGAGRRAAREVDELMARQAGVPEDAASPFGMRRRLLELERHARLFLDASAERPIVLAVEDLHLADPLTLETIQYLARAVSSRGGRAGPRKARAPLLLLATFRPEEVTGRLTEARLRELLGAPDSEVVHLEPFGKLDVRRFLAAVLEGRKPPRGLAEALLERTRGNPLFLEETLQALVQTGALADQGGRLRLTRRIEDLTLPRSLVEVLEGRLAKLSRRETRALRRLAFFQRPFSPGEVPADWVPAGADPRRWLLELSTRGFLERRGERFSVAPPGLSAVLRRGTPRRRRRRIHAAIAASLERAASGLPEEIALHVLSAGDEIPAERRRKATDDAARAIESLAARLELETIRWIHEQTLPLIDPRSGARLLLEAALAEAHERSGDHGEARRLLHRLLRAGQRAPHAGRPSFLRPACLLRRLAGLATSRGRHGEAHRLLARARRCVGSSAEDRIEALRIAHEEARASFAEGRREEARELALRNLGAAAPLTRLAKDRPADAADLRSRVTNQLGAIASALSRFEEAYGWYSRSLRELGARPPGILEAGILCNLGNAATVTGRRGAARRHYREALRIARDVGALDVQALVQGNLAVQALLEWDLGAAAESIDEALALTERIGARRQGSFALLLEGALRTREGDLRRAREVFEEARRRYEADGDRYGVMNALLQASYPAILLGDLDEALAMIERGAELAGGLGWARGTLESKLLLGMLFLHAGSPAEARRELRAAIEAAEGHSLPLDAELGFHHGWALREIGELEAARRETRAALQSYEALRSRPLVLLARVAIEKIDAMEGRTRRGAAERVASAVRADLPPVPRILAATETARTLLALEEASREERRREAATLAKPLEAVGRALAAARDAAKRTGSAHLEWRVLDLQGQVARRLAAPGKAHELFQAARRAAAKAIDRLSPEMRSRYARTEAWTRLHASPERVAAGGGEQGGEPAREETRVLARPARPLDALSGTSPAVRRALLAIERLAPTDLPVLIAGETGTGKEAAARRVHDLSRRRSGPLVVESCASIPEPLFESEMFGHVRGAFTDAGSDRTGRIRQAAGGTLFLAEVCDLPLACQKKLARALKERAVRPVGGSHAIAVDFRLLASSSKSLEAEVAAGRFLRELKDLLGAEVRLPPLRERIEDIPELARRLADAEARRRGRDVHLEDGLIAELQRWPWPGNVRELENALRKLFVTGGDRLTAADLRPEDGGAGAAPSILAAGVKGRLSYRDALEALDREYLLHALERSGGNIVAAARLLGLNRRSLYKKMARHGVAPALTRRARR